MKEEANENINVHMAEGQKTAELIIRKVEKVNELPVKEPLKINIYGTIGTIVEFLNKRWNAEDHQIDKERTHIIVDRDGLRMTLNINENDEYNAGTIVGSLVLSAQYKAFGINSDKVAWEPNELGQFCKMNRVWFENKAENMELVSILKSFIADVNVKMEREQKENGSFKDNYSGIVNSNLPRSFKLKIPIFKGSAPEVLDVEFYAKVSGRDVTLSLYSPDAITVVNEVCGRIMDEEIEKIREIAPEIPILEV